MIKAPYTAETTYKPMMSHSIEIRPESWRTSTINPGLSGMSCSLRQVPKQAWLGDFVWLRAATKVAISPSLLIAPESG